MGKAAEGTRSAAVVGAEEDATAASPGTTASSSASPVLGLLLAARPKQWLKNLLLVAAPGAAGVLDEGDVLWRVGLAFAAFCLVASGTYLLNDVRDAERDRAHPVKALRPIAAGTLSVRFAVVAALVLLALGAAAALAVGLGFAGVVGLYVLLSTSYTLWLKEVAVIDIATVASGFVIRAVAGGVAAGVPISRWFLIVTSFGSLFMVTGKRHGEHLDLGPERASIRTTLGHYPREYLRYVWTVSSGVMVAAYCLWAFEQEPRDSTLPWFELSIIPFVLFVLRYALLLESGRGSAPEDLVIGDRTLRVLSVAWIAVFGAGVYLGR